MIINRAHIPWVILVLLGTSAAGLLYLANFYPQTLPPTIQLPQFLLEAPRNRGKVGGTPLGITYGSAALSIFIFAMLLGFRKRKRTWQIGHVQHWLRAHIWLTIFTIPLVAFHSDFKAGSDMTRLLLLLYGVVMLSGFYGLALQQFMPHLMMERLPQEAVYEEIPYLQGLLRESAKKLRKSFQSKKTFGNADKVPAGLPIIPGRASTAVAAKTFVESEDTSIPMLIAFLDSKVLPYLYAKRGDRLPLGKQRFSDDAFQLLKLSVKEPYHANVEEMQDWCDRRRWMDLQARLHHWLHGWLFVHVPMSFLLLMLTLWHAVEALFFF